MKQIKYIVDNWDEIVVIVTIIYGLYTSMYKLFTELEKFITDLKGC